ncbi:MAG: CbtA family protein [Campylobacteraceae bacterium]|nr:CbtA family protein [Campylobacteraceae bacterium]
MIRQIFLTALLTGVLAGFVLTSLQSVKVIPLILAAEEFEGGEVVTYGSHATTQTTHSTSDNHHETETVVAHAHENAEAAVNGHSHDAEAWGPADGFERLFYTFVANVFLATGWSFLLCAVFMNLRNINVLKGIIAGSVGYLTFFALPSIGLSPELPGTLAAALEHRQMWWIATVACSAIGFAVLFFNKNRAYQIAGLALVLLPHVIGAPVPDVHGGTAPEAMFDSYVNATFITNGIFWLILGAISVMLFKRFQPQEA